MLTDYKKQTIAIDAMGGDNAPGIVLKGLGLVQSSRDVHFLIFGDKNILAQHLPCLSGLSYEIRHSSAYVDSSTSIKQGIRIGKESSMGMAIGAVKNAEAAAVISAGNTGVYMALAKMILGTFSGINRPAIASVIPGESGKCIFLDLGANASCDMKNLVDFAIMGEAIARSVFDKEDPKIALLNIGSEQIKGSPLIKETAQFFEEHFSNYVGFVEGNDISRGIVDVIVTDGFTGNVALKTMEGTAKFIVSALKDALNSSWISKIACLLLYSDLQKFKRKMDPRLYNGAILAGLNGVVVKSHGGTDDIGFANAVQFTIDTLKKDIFANIKHKLEQKFSNDLLRTVTDDGSVS